MSNNSEKKFRLCFTQDFGSVSYHVDVVAETAEDAVDAYYDDMETYDPKWLKKAIALAQSVGIDPDGTPIYEGEGEVDEE